MIRKYLLGELSEEEQLGFEELYLADDALYQQVAIQEDELRYDYAQGVLPARQRERFEQRFLADPGGKARVELAKAVLNESFARAKQEPAAKREPVETVSWWRTLFSFSSPVFAGAAAAVVIGSGYLLYELNHLKVEMAALEGRSQAVVSQSSEAQRRLSQELDQERVRRAELEKVLANRKPAANPFLAFFLAPGLTRDLEGSKKLALTPGMDAVRLDLDLKRGGFARYSIALLTLDGDQLWSQSSQSAGKIVQIMVPARILRPGDYMVEVKGTTAAGETEPAGDYYFTVVPR